MSLGKGTIWHSNSRMREGQRGDKIFQRATSCGYGVRWQSDSGDTALDEAFMAPMRVRSAGLGSYLGARDAGLLLWFPRSHRNHIHTHGECLVPAADEDTAHGGNVGVIATPTDRDMPQGRKTIVGGIDVEPA